MNTLNPGNPDVTKVKEHPLFKIGNVLLVEYTDKTGNKSKVGGFVSNHKENYVELSYVDPNQSISKYQLANPFTGHTFGEFYEPICSGAIHGISDTLFSIKPKFTYSGNNGQNLEYSSTFTVIEKNYRAVENLKDIQIDQINIGDLVFLDASEVNICGFVIGIAEERKHLRLSHFDPNSYLNKSSMIYRFTPNILDRKDLDFRVSRFNKLYRLLDAYDCETEKRLDDRDFSQ
jgi:hypothetical protein